MKIGILIFSGSKLDASSGHERICEAIIAAGHEAFVFYRRDITFINLDGKPIVLYQGLPIEQVDVIISRPTFTEEPSLHTHIISLLEQAGFEVINDANSILFSKNKLAQHVAFSDAGLPMPLWGIAHSGRGAMDIAEAIGFPVIVKVPFGTWGTGVFFAPQPEVLQTIAHYLVVRDENPLIVEEFVASAQRRDVRIFVVGGVVVAAMERVARDNDVRANTSIGGEGTPVQITEFEQELALRATQISGLEIAGVDIIRSDRGPLILEINSNPGFKELERVTGAGIADAIADYAIYRALD